MNSPGHIALPIGETQQINADKLDRAFARMSIDEAISATGRALLNAQASLTLHPSCADSIRIALARLEGAKQFTKE